eukprot:TRINITY_DN9344_c0_g1_i1.p1 TRINITY_DN9344_c0_g1~~TRINITY_DN9344_c0_g1_i1.p1  ORF type:complete len:145 (+),score=31.41 TRINITY_DN9344_c0_g1_i1:48-437(+)
MFDKLGLFDTFMLSQSQCFLGHGISSLAGVVSALMNKDKSKKIKLLDQLDNWELFFGTHPLTLKKVLKYVKQKTPLNKVPPNLSFLVEWFGTFNRSMILDSYMVKNKTVAPTPSKTVISEERGQENSNK